VSLHGNLNSPPKETYYQVFGLKVPTWVPIVTGALAIGAGLLLIKKKEQNKDEKAS
jgi:hypothetical protein